MFLDAQDKSVKVTVDGHVIEILRARLGKYLALEQLERAKDIRGYLNECGVSTDGAGIELLEAYVILTSFNKPTVILPFMKAHQGPDVKKPEFWDYEERWAVSWIHLVASSYHWSRAEILDLDVDEFFHYIQEILIDRQFNKEWEYGLTSIAYPEGKFKPLERPIWMKDIPKKMGKRILKSM